MKCSECGTRQYNTNHSCIECGRLFTEKAILRAILAELKELNDDG